MGALKEFIAAPIDCANFSIEIEVSSGGRIKEAGESKIKIFDSGTWDISP